MSHPFANRRGAVALVAVTFLFAASARGAPNLPPGFAEVLVLNGLHHPTSLDFGPGGELWISGQAGEVWIYRGGSPILAARLPVDTQGERGISGIALDPDYATNHYVWLDYTLQTPPIHNRLSHFTNVGDQLVNEQVILEGPSVQNFFHNGGCLRFAPDKTLFFTMGDDGQGSQSQDPHSLLGKIFHVNRDGSPAAGNPFLDGVAGDPRVWAYGFRNPWRFDVQPVTGNLFIGDVGAATWEEVDLGVPGGNFGWPNVEGPAPAGQPNVIYPLYSFPHDPVLGAAVIGGDHARANSFSPEYQGDYFFADHTSGRLFRMRLDVRNVPLSTEVWATGLGLPTELRFGSDGALYYLAFNEGEIRKLVYVGGDNRQPIASGTVTPDAGPSPLGVAFDASASHDPEGEALSYQWTFGDGQVSTQAVVAHTYAPGAYMANLRVADNDGGSDSTPPFRIVSGNGRPEAQITSPVEGDSYQVGQRIVFIGTARDPEDGPLACGQFHWAVILHHLQHTHPFLGPLQGVCQGAFTVPRDLSGHSVMGQDISFEVRLSVDDLGTPLGTSGTLAGTVSVVIKPEKELRPRPHFP